MSGAKFDAILGLLRERDDVHTPDISGTYGNIYIPAGAMIPDDTNGALPDTVDNTNHSVDYYAFDGSTDESVFFSMAMPDDWNLGTVKMKFFWTGSSGCSNADTVEWGVAAVAKSDDDTFDVAMGTAVTVNDAVDAGVEADHRIITIASGLTIGGTPALGDLVDFKIYRDTSEDTMAEDAWLYGVQIQYTRGSQPSAW